MRIIREADGGIYTHKKKFLSSIEAINEVGADIPEIYDILLENETLSKAVFIHRGVTIGNIWKPEVLEMAEDYYPRQ